MKQPKRKNDDVAQLQPDANHDRSGAGVGRLWTRVLIVSTLLIVAGAIVYDLYPSLVLPYRVDSFLEVVEMGAQRRQVEAELAARGFEVPKDYEVAGDLNQVYMIRSREPILERVADAIALSLGRSKWWDSKKYPHLGHISYDTSGTITHLELSSQFNPLWY